MRVNRKMERMRGELEAKFISIVTWFKIEFHKSSAVGNHLHTLRVKPKVRENTRGDFYSFFFCVRHSYRNLYILLLKSENFVDVEGLLLGKNSFFSGGGALLF